ncbi:MAG: hypothetical protein VW741_02510 [Flammeovirgaceae bacterium]
MLRYKSFEIQAILNADIVLQNNLADRSWEFVNQINEDYPSLNVFAMPMISMKAQYLLAKDSIDKGIRYLEIGAKRNPYLKFSESLLGDTYMKLNDYEKFDKYTRSAFNGMPNNPVHFIMLVKLLKTQNKNDSIVYYYNKIDNLAKGKDPQFSNIVLSSLIVHPDTVEKYNAKKIADESLKRFPNYGQVRKLHDYVYFTPENIDLAEDIYDEAMFNLRQNKTGEGIELLKEAIELHPTSQLYQDNLIIAFYNLRNYEQVSDLFYDYRKQFKEIDSKILFYSAYSLYTNDDYETSCTILKDLEQEGVINNLNQLFSECKKVISSN